MVCEVTLFVLWCFTGWAFNRFAKNTRSEIARLKIENLKIAKSQIVQHERIDKMQLEIASLQSQKCLTTEPAKPKIIPKPQRTTWKQFRAAVENASDESEER